MTTDRRTNDEKISKIHCADDGLYIPSASLAGWTNNRCVIAYDMTISVTSNRPYLISVWSGVCITTRIRVIWQKAKSLFSQFLFSDSPGDSIRVCETDDLTAVCNCMSCLDVRHTQFSLHLMGHRHLSSTCSVSVYLPNGIWIRRPYARMWQTTWRTTLRRNV